jgi:hypothetical protein
VIPAIKIARGIARDQSQRRRAIAAILTVAILLLGLGLFPLWNLFPAHPLFFAIYWLACAWLTICVLLLAIYDLLMILRQGRAEHAAARRRMFEKTD